MNGEEQCQITHGDIENCDKIKKKLIPKDDLSEYIRITKERRSQQNTVRSSVC